MLKDIQILDYLESTGAITYSFDENNTYVEGTKNLVQKIIKKILTLRGSNSYNPDIGSNFFELFSSIDTRQIDTIKGIFPMLLKDIVTQIKREQLEMELGGRTIPDSELLDDLILEEILFDDILTGWILTITIKTKSNTNITVRIV